MSEILDVFTLIDHPVYLSRCIVIIEPKSGKRKRIFCMKNVKTIQVTTWNDKSIPFSKRQRVAKIRNKKMNQRGENI